MASNSQRQRPPDLSPIYTGLAAFLLGIAIPTYAIPNLSLHRSESIYTLLPMAWSALRLSLLIGRASARLLEIAAWTFMYSFLTLPWVAQVANRQFPLGTDLSYNDSTISQTTFIIIIGILAYEVGHTVVRFRRPISATWTNTSPKEDRALNISPRASLFVAYIGFIFVLVAIARYGLSSFFISRDALTQSFLGPAPTGVKFYLSEDKASGTALLLASQVPVFVGTYLLLYLQHAAKCIDGRRLVPWSLLIPLIVANLIINNPLANARSWYGTVIIGFASIYLPLRESKPAARTFSLLYVGISLFSFHQLAAFRRTGEQDFHAIPIRSSLIADPDFGSPQQIMNCVVYLSSHGLHLGRQLLGSVLVWFPHTLWANKPGDTGQLVGGSAGFKVAAPLWAEGLVDFGLLGVLLYLVLIGVLVAKLDGKYVRSANLPNLAAAFAPVMSSLLVFIMRGSLQPAIGLILPVVVCTLLTIRRRPHRKIRNDRN